MSAAEQLDQVTREIHPRQDTVSARVRYVIELMASGLYERGVTSRELAADWGLSVKSTEEYAAQASRHLELLGQREHVLQMVRNRAAQWIDQFGPDRVPAAKLLIETVGGIVQRHEHKVELSNRSDAELFVLCMTEIRSDPALRAKAIAFLQSESADVALLTEGEAVE
jgi:phosphate uptake regulator